jgi:hypothetical protein
MPVDSAIWRRVTIAHIAALDDKVSHRSVQAVDHKSHLAEPRNFNMFGATSGKNPSVILPNRSSTT